MENLPINGLDIGVIAVLFVGALIGLAVGFVRGGLFVLSWLGAAIATIFAFPLARPYARQYIDNELFADLAGGAILFAVTLVILFLVSSLLGGWVRNSRLNALDRSLGMVSGLATMALILAVAYIAMEQVWPPSKQPGWVRDARSIPLIKSAALSLNEILPDEFKLMGKAAVDDVSDKARDLQRFQKLVRPASEGETSNQAPGYDKRARRALDRIIPQ
ncbi:MAG: CvpA family protein [Rhodospirillaceae bacterium]|jgi:membrane protein required for colicin V production|nr:CvpA family protein [Rhodospirillaceae bacterium]MBT3884807.1 CvpA family protein [Rhodospirillaceae bacterium]MBT4118861.1 CvpA family protein [Rhodospirillaceae bacterium]MBT4671903.1 CvpA family protein [Rhodospirillaceae bacterium]MBT4719060.1 CvpA family protein [Rhodospirillaceae bacterium]